MISQRVDDLEQKDLRTLADTLRDKIGSGIIFITSVRDGQASMLAVVTKDLIGRFNAGELLKEVAAMAGGRGGGKAEMAQGGTSKLDPGQCNGIGVRHHPGALLCSHRMIVLHFLSQKKLRLTFNGLKGGVL